MSNAAPHTHGRAEMSCHTQHPTHGRAEMRHSNQRRVNIKPQQRTWRLEIWMPETLAIGTFHVSWIGGASCAWPWITIVPESVAVLPSATCREEIARGRGVCVWGVPLSAVEATARRVPTPSQRAPLDWRLSSLRRRRYRRAAVTD